MAYRGTTSALGRYVESWYDNLPSRRATRALFVHFTEGGGGWPDVWYCASAAERAKAGYPRGDGPARGVSCNFMILGAAAGVDDGLIVQMLPWGQASGSINPNALRRTNDPTFTAPDGSRVRYGYAASLAVLGNGWRDPNAYGISVELAGKASKGPSARQSASLARLMAEIRRRYGKNVGALGHRDEQDYKACPGKLIRWGSLGGHGIPQEPTEVDVPGILYSLDITAAKTDAERAAAIGTARIVGTGHDLVNPALRKADILDVADGLDLGICLLGTCEEDVTGMLTKGERLVVYNAGSPAVAHISPLRDTGDTFTPLPVAPGPATPGDTKTPVTVDVKAGGKVLQSVTVEV